MSHSQPSHSTNLVITLFLFSSFVIPCQAHQLSEPSPAYWLWAGHKIKSHHANTILYLHQGFVRSVRNNSRAFYRRGFSPHKTPARALFIVIRMEKLLQDKQYVLALVRLIKQWEKHGNKVEGLQLDFDSATAKLLTYSRYLQFVHRILPKEYKLSITGLGDWLSNGKRQHLVAINSAVDEVVFQLYQHKTADSNILPYLSKLQLNGLAFKLGLVQRGQYNKNDLLKLKRLPNYKGTVIFTIKEYGDLNEFTESY